jgi:uncharacterized protein (DUF1778 family)
LDAWLRAEGIYDQTREAAIKRVLTRVKSQLPDRRHFPLSAKQWNAFQRALSAPASASDRLTMLLREKSVFERGKV